MKTVLPSGFVIPSDATQKLLRFADEEYDYYDGIEDRQPDLVLPEDILVTIGINSRIQSAERIRMIHRGLVDKCQGILSSIPADLELTDDNWLESPVEELFTAACSVPWVLMAVATKVFHRKRRSLVPIRDSVLLEHDLGHASIGRTQDKKQAAALGMKCLRVFRDDLLTASNELDVLSLVLSSSGYTMTNLRIFEALVWIEKAKNDVYRKPPMSTA